MPRQLHQKFDIKELDENGPGDHEQHQNDMQRNHMLNQMEVIKKSIEKKDITASEQSDHRHD